MNRSQDAIILFFLKQIETLEKEIRVTKEIITRQEDIIKRHEEAALIINEMFDKIDKTVKKQQENYDAKDHLFC